jgi:hypothetical protein
MVSEGTPEEAAHRMIEFANARGGADNITVIVISFYDAGDQPTLTRRQPRGAAPFPVDIESMITQAIPPTPYRKKRIIKKQRYIPLAVLGVVMLIVLSALGSGLLSRLEAGSPEATVAAVLGATEVLSSNTEVIFPDPNEGETPPLLPETNEGEDADYGEVSTVPSLEETSLSPVTTPQETATDGSAPTADPDTTITPGDSERSGICVSRTDSDLSTLLKKFGIEYDDAQKYHYYICQDQDSPNICGDRIEIPNPDLVQSVWWIEIPQVITGVCQGNGGFLLTQ